MPLTDILMFAVTVFPWRSFANRWDMPSHALSRLSAHTHVAAALWYVINLYAQSRQSQASAGYGV
eukprot:12826663-Alexandrium_andersonii.AAC.1